MVVVLADLQTSHHILWDEVEGSIRSTLIDLMLDQMAHLDFLEGKPYLFIITDNGRRALQAWEMGDV